MSRYLNIRISIQYSCSYITKTSACNEDPITPHFYIEKLGFTGVYIFRYHNFSYENYHFYSQKKSPYIVWAVFVMY